MGKPFAYHLYVGKKEVDLQYLLNEMDLGMIEDRFGRTKVKEIDELSAELILFFAKALS